METDKQKLEQNEESKIGDNQQQKQSKIAATTSPEKPFALKKWNLVATWAWDVECDTCAICRVHLMGIHFKNLKNYETKIHLKRKY